MSTKKMTLIVLGLDVMLLLAIPTSQGRDLCSPMEVSVSASDDGVFVGEYTFYSSSKQIVAEVYKVFPQNAKSYYYALYNGKKYMLEYGGTNPNNGEEVRYFIHVEGERYSVRMRER